jgi:hypothetical protein
MLAICLSFIITTILFTLRGKPVVVGLLLTDPQRFITHGSRPPWFSLYSGRVCISS